MNDFYGIYLFILLPEIAILAVGMRQGCSGPLICIVGVVSLFMLGDDSREALLWLRRAVHAAIILSVICHGASENVVLGTLAKNYSEREKKNWMFFSFSVSGMAMIVVSIGMIAGIIRVIQLGTQAIAYKIPFT